MGTKAPVACFLAAVLLVVTGVAAATVVPPTTTRAAADQLLFDGQSLNLTPEPATAYPAHLLRLLVGRPVSGAVVGVSGTTYAQRAADAAARVDARIVGSPGTRTTVLDLAGQSDLLEGTPAPQVLAAAERYAAGRRAAGADAVVVFTVPPSTWFTPAQDRERLDYNRLLRGSRAFDAVVDVAGVDALDDPADARSWSDGLHPTPAGALAIAHAAYGVVEPLLQRAPAACGFDEAGPDDDAAGLAPVDGGGDIRDACLAMRDGTVVLAVAAAGVDGGGRSSFRWTLETDRGASSLEASVDGGGRVEVRSPTGAACAAAVSPGDAGGQLVVELPTTCIGSPAEVAWSVRLAHDAAPDDPVDPVWLDATPRFGPVAATAAPLPAGMRTAGWSSLGCCAADAPAAVSWGPGRIDLVVRGTDGALHHRSSEGGAWSGWRSLGGQVVGPPAITSWGPGRLDVFVRGTDDALHHQVLADGRWSGWRLLGGVLTSGVGATSWGPGRIDVFVAGTDKAMYTRSFDGTWRPYVRLGGVLTSTPSAASWGLGRIDVVVRGSDGQPYHTAYEGGWKPYAGLGGAIRGDPAITSWGPGRLDVYVRGTDDALHQKVHSGGWSAYHRHGGGLQGSPAATSVRGLAKRNEVFVRGTDQHVHQATFA